MASSSNVLTISVIIRLTAVYMLQIPCGVSHTQVTPTTQAGPNQRPAGQPHALDKDALMAVKRGNVTALRARLSNGVGVDGQARIRSFVADGGVRIQPHACGCRPSQSDGKR